MLTLIFQIHRISYTLFFRLDHTQDFRMPDDQSAIRDRVFRLHSRSCPHLIVDIVTWEAMRNHIATHEPEDVVEEKLKNFDEMVYISKCHRGSLRYPTIKKWFLKEYPDVAKFGTVEIPEEAQKTETNSQNVIPMPEVQAADDAA